MLHTPTLSPRWGPRRLAQEESRTRQTTQIQAGLWSSAHETWPWGSELPREGSRLVEQLHSALILPWEGSCVLTLREEAPLSQSSPSPSPPPSCSTSLLPLEEARCPVSISLMVTQAQFGLSSPPLPSPPIN